MCRLIGVLMLLLSGAILVHGESQTSMKAKAAFAFMNLSKCECLDCDCKDCQCKGGECKCKDCHSFEAVYVKAVKEGQVVVLEVGGVVHLTNTPWRVIQVKSIPGEKAGYIVGVPKDGQLHRLDFGVFTSRERIRLDILHVIYPLTDGYVECPTCPQGRIKNGR
jgi:hypothetical protein